MDRFSRYGALAALRAEVRWFLALMYLDQARSEFSLFACLNRRCFLRTRRRRSWERYGMFLEGLISLVGMVLDMVVMRKSSH